MDTEEKSAMEKIEDTLGDFYNSYSTSSVIKARNAEFSIQPKVFLKDKLNPEIGKMIVRVFLKKVTPKDILDERVIISPKKILIRDSEGKPLVQVIGEDIINKIGNPVTDEIGKALLNMEGREFYSFGDIKDALLKFMGENNLIDEKNPLKESLLLIEKRAA